jgi:hypothetical protein
VMIIAHDLSVSPSLSTDARLTSACR